MTKVLPCYSLCPLVEQKSFLGVAADADADTVVVTTNSNIIGRYRVSEPKEIGSWNSKGSISCGTVYDAGDRHYATVFNGNEIRKWCGADKQVDKVKRYKFAERLHGLSTAPTSGRTLVIFAKGHVRYLDAAIEARKSVAQTSLIADTERIVSFEVVSVSAQLMAVLLVQGPDGCRVVGVAVDAADPLFDVPVRRSDRLLCGQCVVVDRSCYLVSLWSDGKLYRDRVYPNATCVPAHCVATLDELNVEQPVVLKALSAYDVAVCGQQQDGLLLLVFSLRYNSIQCKRRYENGPDAPPQLWSVDSKLFLVLGHNLVVIPYVQQNRRLSTLIGSTQVECDESVLPDAQFCEQSLPAWLQRDQEDRVRQLLTSGRDVPDSALLATLTWALKDVDRRGDILDLVLTEYCASPTDVSEVRAACSVDQSLFVLERIMGRLQRGDNNQKPLKWASLLVDAFCQQYVMSDDTSIVSKLSEYFGALTKEESYVNEFMQLASVLSCVQRKKVILSS